MGKKLYIPICKQGKQYKIFMDDLIKVHSIHKSQRPPVPCYELINSPTRSTKFEEMTDVEFEPFTFL